MALEMAARFGSRVGRIDLISAAAPLACGVDLAELAGGTLFALARDAPARFGAATAIQRLVSRAAPALLTRMVFAKAAGMDRSLIRSPLFRARIAEIIRNSLLGGTQGYRRELLAYVQPWEQILSHVAAPVTLWHGDQDNWAPPMMAQWLANALPNVAMLHTLPGLSHYSTLRHVLEQHDNVLLPSDGYQL